MKITKTFGEYNHRRFSKPWIAKITEWEVGCSPTLKFGRFLGGSCGGGGDVEVEAEMGDIVRWGIKDNRGSRGISKWGIVRPDGCVDTCTQSVARRNYQLCQKYELEFTVCMNQKEMDELFEKVKL